ncbi:hypothetical protein ABZT49_19925 [Methylobacterium sp. EM32]|uniref:hypothetical protein n=1 Tax=Methylobacterium sp. EM32 TaxID=3163481 RepID=UPI0033A2585C
MTHSTLRKGRWRQLAFGPRRSSPRTSDVVLAIVAISSLAGLCLLAAANAVGSGAVMHG